MGLIIDTCVFISAERNAHQPLDFGRFSSYGEAYISRITVSELLIGVYHADSKARRLKRSAFVEAIISKIPSLPFSSETARIHAELYAHLAQKGKIIGAHDLIIAATAISHDCALLTKNHGEFARVPGLNLLKI